MLLQTDREKYIVLLSGGVLFIVLFSFAFVGREDPIYFWDGAAYYGDFIRYGEFFRNSPFDALKQAFWAIRNIEYHPAPVLLPFMTFAPALGPSRIAYILSLALFYLAPVCCLFPFMSLRIFGEDKSRRLLTAACLMACIFLFSPLWIPMLMGYTGICGLVPLIVAFYIGMTTDIAKKISVKPMIILGLCLYGTFFFHRWYAFTVASFYVAYSVSSLLHCEKNNRFQGVWNIAMNSLLAAGVTFLCIILLQLPLFKLIINARYGYMYSAYKMSFMSNVTNIYKTIGPIYFIFAALALVLSFYRKKNVHAHVFMGLFCTVLFISFGSLQFIDVHHRMPLALGIVFLAASGILQCCALLSGKASSLLCLGLIGFFCLSFVGTFKTLPERLRPLFPAAHCMPLRYAPGSEMPRLKADLEQLTFNSSARYAIFSSSVVLNDGLVLFNQGELGKHIISTGHIDKRDGVSLRPLLAEYVVVTTPPQTHKSPEEQTVVTVPNEKIVQGQGIGAAYANMGKKYVIAPGVTAYLYKRQRLFTQAELDDYFASFPADHINWNNQPTPEELEALKQR